MEDNKTYYDVLNVSTNATDEEIKRAYHKLIKLWHPDLHPEDVNAEIRTRKINEAYEVLSDPEKRSKYDESILLYPYEDDFEDLSYEDHKFNENAYREYVSRENFTRETPKKDPLLKVIAILLSAVTLLAIILCVCFYFAGVDVPYGQIIWAAVFLPLALLVIVLIVMKNGSKS